MKFNKFFSFKKNGHKPSLREYSHHKHVMHGIEIALGCFLVALIGGSTAGIIHHNDSRQQAIYNSQRPVHHIFYAKKNRIGQQKLLPLNVRKKVPKDKSAKAIVAMDAKTGKIIYQKNDKKPLRVASVAKLMTLYLVERKMYNSGQSWNTIVPQANHTNLRKMSYDSTLGGFKFKPKHHYTVQDLFQAAVIDSSNNAMIALGEWVAGSNRNCVKLMNEQAHAWNLSARFVSPSGLENNDLRKYHLTVNNNKNDANTLSAKDVSIIAQHLLHSYPSFTKTSSRSQAKIDGQKINNINRLLPGQSDYQRNLNVNGLKTGFTPSAGFCFVSSSHKAGKDPLITVVLHDNNEFDNTRNLINYLDSHSKA